jgi:hypothetical protein
MATGDMKWFAAGLEQLINKVHGPTDDYRLGIVTTATVPAVNTAIPHWGGTGTTNFATNQVGTGGTSYTAPVDLAAVTVTGTATGFTLGFDAVSLAQDASGFTDGAYGIVYNNTDANKRAIGYVEISSAGTASLVTGPITITFNSDATAGTALQVVQS